MVTGTTLCSVLCVFSLHGSYIQCSYIIIYNSRYRNCKHWLVSDLLFCRSHNHSDAWVWFIRNWTFLDINYKLITLISKSTRGRRLPPRQIRPDQSPDPDSGLGWLPKFHMNFLVLMSLWRSDQLFQSYEPNCGMMAYISQCWRILKKFLDPYRKADTDMDGANREFITSFLVIDTSLVTFF